ncbi:MAG: putative lipid II flippase FtsW [Candidatus Yonathbacteria bacterium]|nr:putative lipid II flippase FtsW [Candidatus Yonathbacteria bacterium]
MANRSIDKVFLATVIFLMLGGFFIFMSASLGLLARQGPQFGATAFNQAFFGLFLGSIALAVFSKIEYLFWKKYAIHIFALSIIATALVFVPALGFTHGGARRWLDLGFVTFQPSEFLKFGVVLYLAAWFSSVKYKVNSVKWGLLPLLVVIGIAGLLLLLQPDMDTFLVISVASVSMFFVAGGKWRHMLALFGIAAIGFTLIVFSKPYLMERVLTFVDPSRDPSGAGWQIQQSLIAVGSGEMFGKGFGQSIQKFKFLPEPIGDSIFAVAAEEFGFVGGMVIIVAFILFLLRGLSIARRAPDTFSGLLVSGIVIMIVFQSLINIAAIIGVFPLSGLPLPFISHGGTALLFALIEVGIVLNISRYKRNI